MAKSKELKDVDDILAEAVESIPEPEVSTVDSKEEEAIPDAEPQEKQSCKDCANFIVCSGIVRKAGFRTCVWLKNNNDIMAFYSNGIRSAFLMRETFVPDIFPTCKGYTKR